MYLVGNKRADIARVIPCKNNFCTKFAHRFHFCGLQKLNTLNLRLFHPPLNPCNHFPTVLIKTNWYTISYKFALCNSLTSINIPDSVTTIGNHAFYNCKSLTSINISNGVMSIGDNAFEGCVSLKSINIPDSITSIGDYAFGECDSLSPQVKSDIIQRFGENVF